MKLTPILRGIIYDSSLDLFRSRRLASRYLPSSGSRARFSWKKIKINFFLKFSVKSERGDLSEKNYWKIKHCCQNFRKQHLICLFISSSPSSQSCFIMVISEPCGSASALSSSFGFLKFENIIPRKTHFSSKEIMFF